MWPEDEEQIRRWQREYDAMTRKEQREMQQRTGFEPTDGGWCGLLIAAIVGGAAYVAALVDAAGRVLA